MTTLVYETGSILVMTMGEYSDFRNAGFLVAVKPLNLPDLAKQFKAECAVEDDLYLPLGDFPSWLIKGGYAMPVDYHEVFLGAYGEFEDEFMTEDESE